MTQEGKITAFSRSKPEIVLNFRTKDDIGFRVLFSFKHTLRNLLRKILSFSHLECRKIISLAKNTTASKGLKTLFKSKLVNRWTSLKKIAAESRANCVRTLRVLIPWKKNNVFYWYENMLSSHASSDFEKKNLNDIFYQKFRNVTF